jgi:hypothetical protein
MATAGNSTSTYYASGLQWHSNTGAPATTSTSGPPGGGWHAFSSPLGQPLPPPSRHEALGLGSKGTFTYEELAAATGNFSQANLLGQGGFGYVHKGVLPGGRTVAVKQLKPGSGQGEREFQAEVDIISRVHHRHLVSLVGYCIAGAHRVLVYEFVPNKTLEFHLHGQWQNFELAHKLAFLAGSLPCMHGFTCLGCRERAAGDGLGDEAAHCSWGGQRARLPARRL